MAALIFLGIFIALALLGPWLGSDSRPQDDHQHADTYPGRPEATTR